METTNNTPLLLDINGDHPVATAARRLLQAGRGMREDGPLGLEANEKAAYAVLLAAIDDHAHLRVAEAWADAEDRAEAEAQEAAVEAETKAA